MDRLNEIEREQRESELQLLKEKLQALESKQESAQEEDSRYKKLERRATTNPNREADEEYLKQK